MNVDGVGVFRGEPSLPHDLHQRQVQSEHRPAGLLLRHLGPPGNHVRHAGSGEDAHTQTHSYFIHVSLMCVCVCDAARVGDLAVSKLGEELLSA